ncbi:very short patch repair endonuclease [Microbulbifer sp. SA54]|uniref:very short patch repair endonuclease n=1 Tax=Microbulbifer sp. SA54 TaxID=3401577 RepID=UPI003AAE2723
MDIVDREKRSQMMAGIRGQDTRPEKIIRSGLHRLGLRHRLGSSYKWQGKRLPGRPDLVFPKYRAVIQVNGCFWHCHGCHLFKWPSSREAFWRKKLEGNAERDVRNLKNLEQCGWRVLTIWECALKGKTRAPSEEVIFFAADWIRSDAPSTSIGGLKV